MSLFPNGLNGKPEFSSSFRINYQWVIYVNKREKYIRVSFSRSFRSEWLSSMIYMAEKDIVSTLIIFREIETNNSLILSSWQQETGGVCG